MVSDKSHILAKVWCKHFSFSFFYEKACISKKCQKSSGTISHILNYVIMRYYEQNKLMQWRNTWFQLNYNDGTDKDTVKVRKHYLYNEKHFWNTVMEIKTHVSIMPGTSCNCFTNLFSLINLSVFFKQSLVSIFFNLI